MQKKKNALVRAVKKFLNALVIIVAIVGVIGIVPAIVYVHWCAYFQRFPNASWWTFFFQR
jgi:hypothetical protein